MTKTFPVHPDAAIFPMMPPDDLASLVESIKTGGLIHPIVLGKWERDGQMIEGIGKDDAAVWL
jgi:hypothetical protein